MILVGLVEEIFHTEIDIKYFVQAVTTPQIQTDCVSDWVIGDKVPCVHVVFRQTGI
jgi:hypothetical protein